MRKFILGLFFVFSAVSFSYAQSESLLIDDFEGALSGPPSGTVDFGAGGGCSLEVSADTQIKYSGKQSLKAQYNAVSGGYMWIARGFGLDAQNSSWLIKPEEIAWQDYKAFSFYLYGNNSKVQVAFDIKDSGNEMWRFLVEDNFTGWKQVVCPFKDFFPRDDWQPDSADKNALLDFPLKSFQFEPRPEAKGTLYFDSVSLVK
jgi:hypothetical protein